MTTTAAAAKLKFLWVWIVLNKYMVKMFGQAYKGVSVEFYVRVCEYAYDVSV